MDLKPTITWRLEGTPNMAHLVDMMNRQQRLDWLVSILHQEKHPLSRADLLILADDWRLPFKTLAERLEREYIIPFGTYDELMRRVGTVKALRKMVARVEA